MPTPNKPPFPRRQLGRVLRRLREQARLTQEEAGQPIRISKSKLSRIEQGHLPGYNDFLALLDRYGVLASDYDEYVQAFDEARRPVWWPTNLPRSRGFVDLEASACAVRNYQLGLLPGLLQTADYARTLFETTGSPLPVDKREEQVWVRLKRQHRLVEEPVLQAFFVVDEGVLQRPPCDRAQLEKLVESAALPSVSLQVLPVDRPPDEGLDSSFVIVDFPDPEEHGVVYVETGFRSIHLEKPGDLTGARRVFDRLTRLALSEADSVDLIKQLAVDS